ncbi:MAG TPA: UDP-N-acetylmuramoyl-tripeptide--D-alanyl-D-alanine ligase [Solirubrobacterales bacterium]|nr:UDP-N-acetylmuramoyl-tripeptide--D-alanyl-D-alanine ligase [Solirubrobacterales bacterium]
MSPLAWIALVLGAATTLALLAGRLHLFLHLLQLEHYELRRLRVWVARRGERLAPRDLALGAGSAVLLAVAFAIGLPALAAALAAAGLALAAVRARAVLGRDQVKPLQFTPRATRLYATALVFAALALAVPVVLAALTTPTLGAVALVAIAAALLLLTPELLGLANLAMRPVQRADNARFERRARRRLRDVAPLVIGITGSYGKTTTKGCVAQVANLAGLTLPTPASFNSYLGVIRTINENLRPDHRTFVVEMGAYRRGDIAELCRLVEPRIGILTAIGPAHLERFGTLEQTTLAKGELAEGLPADGIFITRADDARCRAAAERAPCPVRLFSPDPHPEATAWAENARLDEGRSRFDLCLREEGGTVRHAVSARLLGRHNVANLLAAALAGVELGLAPEQIARALGQVAPPEHRLSPIVNRAAGIVVIDDAYNANPAGAEAALEVLAAHPGKRRILVTPGMVELGDREEAENERFGTAAAAVCDIVVLVGEKQAAPIRRGLEAAGFAADALRTVADSAGAERLLAETSRAGDVILFENDLPDLYRGQAGGAETTAAAA